jgi:hypothetical protein
MPWRETAPIDERSRFGDEVGLLRFESEGRAGHYILRTSRRD